MDSRARLFRIDPGTRESELVTEVDFAKAGFKERQQPRHIGRGAAGNCKGVWRFRQDTGEG